jgi:NTE family protein
MNASKISDTALMRLGPALRLQRQTTAPQTRSPDRVISIIALAESLPSSVIAESLSAALEFETGDRVLLIQIGPAEFPTICAEWSRVGSNHAEAAFTLGQHLEAWGENQMRLRLRVTGLPFEQQMVRQLLQQCAHFFDYVVLDVAKESPGVVLLECIHNADVTYLFVRATPLDFSKRDLLAKQALELADRTPILKTIVCRAGPNASPDPFTRQGGTRIDGFINGYPHGDGSCDTAAGNYQSDIRRLAREVSRRRVGLALSSGGARGLAHIGVIQVLEENGIEVDVIAGCSMGSYVGAIWAFGFDGARMERLAREVEHKWGLIELIDPFFLPRQGFLRGEKVKKRLKRTIGDIHFTELRRPLRIVATHLATLSRTVFSSGEVAQVVHASSAIPGACVPVTVDEELYIDGGIADPLPVDVLEEMGIERIIAVNTIPTPEFLRARLEMERERALRFGRRASKVKSFINRYMNYFAPGNVLDTILRSFNGAQMQVAEHSCLSADLVLRPLSHDGRWHDFRHPGKYIAIGRREAEQHLDALKSLIKRKTSINEP